MEKNNNTYLLCGVLNTGTAWDTAYIVKLFDGTKDTNVEPFVANFFITNELFQVSRVSMQELTELCANNQVANVKKLSNIPEFFIMSTGSKEISIVFNLLEYTKFWAFTVFLDSYGRLQCLPNDLLGIMIDCEYFEVVGNTPFVTNTARFKSYKPYFRLNDRQTKSYKEYLKATSKNAVLIENEHVVDFLTSLFRLVHDTVAGVATNLYSEDVELLRKRAEQVGCDTVERLLGSRDFRGYYNCLTTNRVICELCDEYTYGSVMTIWLRNIQAYGDRVPLGSKQGSEILYCFASIACLTEIKASEHQRVTPIEVDRVNSLINFGGRVIKADVGYGGKLWQYGVPYLFPDLDTTAYRGGDARLKLAISTPGWATVQARSYDLDLELILGNRGATNVRVLDTQIMYDEQPKGEFNYALIKELEFSRSGYSSMDLYDRNRTTVEVKTGDSSGIKEFIGGEYDKAGFKNLLYNYGISESTKKGLVIGSLSYVCTRNDILLEVRSVKETKEIGLATDILNLSYYNKGKLVYSGFLNASVIKLSTVLNNLLNTSTVGISGIDEDNTANQRYRSPVISDTTCKSTYNVCYSAKDNKSCAKYLFDQYSILETKQITRYISVGIIKATGEIVVCYRLPGIYFNDFGVACAEYRINLEVVTNDDNLSVINEFTYVPVIVAQTLDSAVTLGLALSKLCSVSNLDKWFTGEYRYDRAYLCLTAKTPSEKAENIAYYLQRRILDDVIESFSVIFMDIKWELGEEIANELSIPWEE